MDGIYRHVACLLCFTIFIAKARNYELHPGHHLPLGSHVAPITVKRLTYLPSPTEFYQNFVEKRLPVVMEGAMTASKVFNNWQSDDYLR